MNRFTLFLWVLFALAIGHAYGFRQGVESSDYDRVHANKKLQHCQGQIYERK